MRVSARGVLIWIAIVSALGGIAQAQPTDSASAMKKLAWMLGVWSGPATGRNREASYSITQTERVGSALGGDVIVLEGRGYRSDGSTAFNALAVISWDAARGYEMRSYTHGGAGTFGLTVSDAGWSWELPVGKGVIRYVADFKEGVWREKGDAVFPNAPSTRVFEDNLKKIADTDWPSDKPVTPGAP